MKRIKNMLQKIFVTAIAWSIILFVFFAFLGDPDTREDTLETIEGLGKVTAKKMKHTKKNAVKAFQKSDFEGTWKGWGKSWDNFQKEYEKSAKERAKSRQRNDRSKKINNRDI